MDYLRFVIAQCDPDASVTGLLPAVGELRLGARVTEKRLLPHYTDYVERVSSPGMSLSLETSVVLDLLCEWTHPRRILDLGSGFSSFVLRSCAERSPHPCRVVTVDDDLLWLERTRDFLREKNISQRDMYPWEECGISKEEPFDLILHDLGSMNTREEVLPRVLAVAGEKTLLVLDDMHKDYYRETALEMLGEYRCGCVPLREETEDQFGRYACVAHGFAGKREG